MHKFRILVERAHKDHQGRLDCLFAHEQIIETLDNLIKDYKEEPGIESVRSVYPMHSTDYLLILVYLTEKGSIKKDIGVLIEDLQERTDLKLLEEPKVDAKKQVKTWQLVDKTTSWITAFSSPMYVRVTIQVSAEKSKKCTRVPTGEMEPVYEFVCEDE